MLKRTRRNNLNFGKHTRTRIRISTQLNRYTLMPIATDDFTLIVRREGYTPPPQPGNGNGDGS